MLKPFFSEHISKLFLEKPEDIKFSLKVEVGIGKGENEIKDGGK